MYMHEKAQWQAEQGYKEGIGDGQPERVADFVGSALW
jgi:hypothetical protein